MNQTEPIFGADKTPEEREKLLEAHAVHKERTTFTQELTTEEYFALQNEFTRGHIDLARMEGEAKEASDQWKARIKDKESTLDKALEQINAGKRQVVGILYSIPNFGKGEMYRYNKAGELIESRPMKAEERQSRAFIAGPDGSTVPNPDERTITDIPHEDVKAEESADEQIAGMYAGPTIAGSAPGSEEMNASHEIGEPLYEEGSKEEGAAVAGVLADQENGMAWDDPRQTRADVSGPAKATEDGAVAAKKKGGRKKKEPQTPENPSGEAQ